MADVPIAIYVATAVRDRVTIHRRTVVHVVRIFALHKVAIIIIVWLRLAENDVVHLHFVVLRDGCVRGLIATVHVRV